MFRQHATGQFLHPRVNDLCAWTDQRNDEQLGQSIGVVPRLQSLSDRSLYDLFSMIAQEHLTSWQHKVFWEVRIGRNNTE